MSNLYRNHFDGTEDLDAYLDIYTLHLFAMTTESLHSKAEITHELAYRDYQIQLLKAELADAGLSPDDNSDTAGISALLQAVGELRNVDCGSWLKDCASPLDINCGHGREARQELRRKLDAVYKTAKAAHPVSDARGAGE